MKGMRELSIMIAKKDWILLSGNQYRESGIQCSKNRFITTS